MKNLIYQFYHNLENEEQAEPEILLQEYGPDVKSISDIYNDIVLVSQESFSKYADLIGAEYVLDTDHSYTRKWMQHNFAVNYEWLKIIFDPKYDVYDKICVVDIDMVANTTQDIFKASDADYYGVSESDWHVSRNKRSLPNEQSLPPSWDQSIDVLTEYVEKYAKHGIQLRHLHKGQNGSRVDSGRLHFQGGLNVFTRNGRLKAREQFISWREWMYEGNLSRNKSKRMSPLNYDECYISANIVDSTIDWEIIDPSWMDIPTFYLDEYVPQETKRIKFPHFCWGGFNKRIMLSMAHEGEFDLVTKYKDHPNRKIPHLFWKNRMVAQTRKDARESFE